MGLLPRKRKRPTTKEAGGPRTSVPSNTSTPRSQNGDEVEEMRTDDTSRTSTSVLNDISTIGNLDKSSRTLRSDPCFSQASGRLSQNLDNTATEEEAPMETNGDNEETCNQWDDDDMILSQIPSETQVGRTVETKSSEEVRNATLNKPECGTIEAITLQNFMCHENFHQELGMN